ncbi:MAG TPA: hypothetical protein VF820_04195 [Patescibacteria group bacterium]
MKTLWHGVILVVSFIIVFIWKQTLLSDFTVQALGILVLAYMVISFIRSKRNPHAERFSSSSDIFILNTAILLIIGITGNIYSPLFFLLYFLGFGITFIFEPVSVFIFALGTIAVFMPEAIKNGSIESFVRLGSILLISPLAYFFGREYQDRDKEEQIIESMEERTKDAADTISKDIEHVLQEEKKVLKDKDIEKLNEILEETEELREESKK